MRFSYLHDARPDALERLRPSRLPEGLHTPLASLATAIVVVVAWWGIEHMLLAQARQELGQQTFRLDASRLALREAKLQRVHVDSLLESDTRLREIRRSGALLASRLADIANHVPTRAWLSSVGQVNDALEIDGHAEGLDGLSDTVADLMSSKTAAAPDLVRASKDQTDHSGELLEFAVRVGGHQ